MNRGEVFSEAHPSTSSSDLQGGSQGEALLDAGEGVDLGLPSVDWK